MSSSAPMVRTRGEARAIGHPVEPPRLSLLLPFHLLVLFTLHVLLAASRLVKLISQLPTWWRDFFTTSAPSRPWVDLARDQKRWSKTPTHLAVVLAPGLSWRAWLGLENEREYEQRTLRKQALDLKLLINWCKELGTVNTLSVYDESGTLCRHAEAVARYFEEASEVTELSKDDLKGDTTSFRVTVPPAPTKNDSITAGQEGDGIGSNVDDEGPRSSASSTTLVAPPPGISPTKTRTSIKINLLSRQDGRPRMAKVAQRLAQEAVSGVKVNDGAIVEAIESSMISEPDLLLVLGGPYLRLHGFPPWQLRLTEMYHHSSPSWLPPPPITYPIFRRALDVFGGAEMRLGR